MVRRAGRSLTSPSDDAAKLVGEGPIENLMAPVRITDHLDRGIFTDPARFADPHRRSHYCCPRPSGG